MTFKKTLLSLAVSMAVTATAFGATSQQDNSKIKHVLLISVDGFHQDDLDWYLKNNHDQNSALAQLVENGVAYKNAMTPVPF